MLTSGIKTWLQLCKEWIKLSSRKVGIQCAKCVSWSTFCMLDGGLSAG